MNTIARAGWALATMLALGVASPVAAQAAPWHTAAGGDPSGDYLSVDRPVHEGSLSGDRVVEHLTRTTGYTTGSLTTIVVSGGEPADARTVRVHLPYGATIDLAEGQTVSVALSSHRLGLGSVHEVRIARGSTLIVLATSAERSTGVTVRRGAAEPGDGSSRHGYALNVTVDGMTATVRPGHLSLLTAASTLMSGGEVVYEGGVRPPDAFDSRTFMAVRIAAMPPQLPTATS